MTTVPSTETREAAQTRETAVAARGTAGSAAGAVRITGDPMRAATRAWAAAVARRREGYSLEAPFYTDEDFYQRDLRAVFSRSWLFVASVAEVPEAGDYVTLEVGRDSVIVIRDDDEEIRAHHNVCRHRGARLLMDRSGSVGNIVCGYHQWTYSPEGDLLHAGLQAPDFDRSCFSLRSVNVKVIAGLIFICLDPNPPGDIDEIAERITPYIAPHSLEHTKVAFQEDIVEDANWKLVMENNRECYHCEGAHPELTTTFFPTYGYPEDQIPKRLFPAHARYLEAEKRLAVDCDRNNLRSELISELSGRPTGFRIQREALDGAGESYTMDGSAASKKLLGSFDTPTLGRLSLHVQPNTWFHFLGDHVVTFSLVPLGVDRTLVRTTWLVHAEAEAGVDYDVDHLTEVWHRTNEEDAELCARAQLGVSSPAYVPGPYAPTESDVDEFCVWYIERLRQYAGEELLAEAAAEDSGTAPGTAPGATGTAAETTIETAEVHS